MERPATGPIPGNAPMNVPTMTPKVTTTRLMGVNATANPRLRLLMKSMKTAGHHPKKARMPLGSGTRSHTANIA